MVRGRLQQLGFWVLVLFAFVPSLRGAFSSDTPRNFVVSDYKQVRSDTIEVALYQESFVQTKKITSFVHSPALTEMSNGDLMAVWYGGPLGPINRDLSLYMSIYDHNKDTWTDVELITDRKQTEADIGRSIYTIGNPVLLTDSKGRIWLFYVTASLRGWSSSAINLKTSDDNGKTWTAARRLVTHPFLNISTLVKGAPFLYVDGSIGLPVYHEFLGVYPELVRISEDGLILDKTRMYYGRTSLQPSIVPTDEKGAISFLRPWFSLWSSSEDTRVLMTRTSDGGYEWTVPIKLGLANPHSAVMGLRLSDGSILLVFNNSTKGRSNLSLAISYDFGKHWRVIYTFEDGDVHKRFSYPYIIQVQDGRINLVYAWNGTHIKHIAFNEAWLKSIAQ